MIRKDCDDRNCNDRKRIKGFSSIVNKGIREFHTFYKKISHAQKAHKQVKTKIVLNAHKKHPRRRKSLIWHKKHKTHIS